MCDATLPITIAYPVSDRSAGSSGNESSSIEPPLLILIGALLLATAPFLVGIWLLGEVRRSQW
ncbi:hypothetical protein RHGRI_014175 [Rhododendron griersonianum]|uniref:Uncharacterized protein n=1 Tax=Rhododendron griersonianum TaxID=479676 RepID=A0AAV6K8X4_9ERIC|nr:hypothetical protein RHGRI_014175 [Rhododendron griersonianum]